MDWIVKTTQTGFHRWATFEEETTLHFDAVMEDGEKYELKNRRQKYFNKKDILIETLSSIERKTLGWIYTTKAEKLAYAFVEIPNVTRGYIFHFPILKSWWRNTGIFNEYQIKHGKTGKLYKTENKVVPLKDIPFEALYYHPDYGLLDHGSGYKIG